jgi:hypothetical protein
MTRYGKLHTPETAPFFLEHPAATELAEEAHELALKIVAAEREVIRAAQAWVSGKQQRAVREAVEALNALEAQR